MGVVAGAGRSAAAGAAATTLPPIQSIGAGAGGVFVAGALLYVIIMLDLLESMENPSYRQTYRMLVGIVASLSVAFVSIILFNTFRIV